LRSRRASSISSAAAAVSSALQSVASAPHCSRLRRLRSVLSPSAWSAGVGGLAAQIWEVSSTMLPLARAAACSGRANCPCSTAIPCVREAPLKGGGEESAGL
jgi:hypothetical protein